MWRRLAGDDATVRAVVEGVVGALDRVLGDALVAVYLHGSAVMGGLRPDSDIDLMVLTTRSLTSPERAALVEELLRVSGRRATQRPGRPIELTGVVVDQVSPWRYPPVRDFQYGEWLRDEYDAGLVPEPMPDPDLAVLVTAAREHAVPLVGPEPADLLPRVPAADLRRAVDDSLPALLADLEGDERNVILTLARMWVTAGTGEVVSKDEAAARMLETLPSELAPVLELARAAYLGAAGDDWDDKAQAVAALVDHATSSIAARMLEGA